jgi:hypothetical protein
MEEISSDQEVLLFVVCFLVFKCAPAYFSLLRLRLRKEYCSAEEGPSTDVQTQLPWDAVRALMFYIVPYSLWKTLERRKMACCYQLDRQRGVLL